MSQAAGISRRLKIEHLGEDALRFIRDAGFGMFVIAVLTLTIIAVTYQPPDPWLQPSRFMDKIFSSIQNATYLKDDSVLVTGEDVSTAASDPPSILPSAIRAEEDALLRVSTGSCDPSDTAINCSEPGVLFAIEKVNFDIFPQMEFFEYSDPVQGSQVSECDAAWKFRPKDEHSDRIYHDFRRYKLKHEVSCVYSVIDVGEWHSGKKAWQQKFYNQDSPNDSVTYIDETNNRRFRNGKYLYYSRGGDYCKGMNHFQWSFLCALGEALYLNRTFVVDLDFCLSGSNNPGHGDEKGKDFRFYFDFEHVMEATSVIEQGQFLKEWQDWNMNHRHDQIPVRVVDDFRVTPMQLQVETSTIVWRTFPQGEPDNYWFRVCEGEPDKVIQRPWHLLWKSKRLMNIVATICGNLEWDFDSVHIVRGEKVNNKNLWPNLDKDTMPENILLKLNGKIERGRKVYVATNEALPGYFDKLRTDYKIYLLQDFRHLWAPGSEWYNETAALNRGQQVDFDGQMQVEVDSEIFFRGKTRVDTFGELTLDCKDGVNNC